MKCVRNSATVCALVVLFWSYVGAAEKPAPDAKPGTPRKHTVINNVYPGLTSGALMYARLASLPEGILLRTKSLVIYEKDITAEIANAPVEIREKLKKNAFFLLEQIATLKLLLAEARTEADKSGKNISEQNEQTIIQDHLRALAKMAKVTDAEILDFYNGNTEMLGGASLAQVKPQIEQFLLRQKQQALIDEHIRTIGGRMQIEISAPWLKVQAALAKDNPVDKARASGKPSLVDFGSTGCVPCDMMAPILDTLKDKYKGKLNVLFVHVKEEPILVNRYGIQSIPIQIFFDKDGTEVYRHVGFFPQSEIEKLLSDMGIE